MFRSPKRKYNKDIEPIEQKENNKPKEKEKEKEKENKEEENIEKYLNEIEEYELEFDDEKYNLKTGYSKEKDSISLKIKPLEQNNKNAIIFYEGLFSSKDLTKLCKSFRMYDSIEEIFSAFCVIFENKKAYLKQNNEKEKDDNLLNLVIVVGSVTGKEDEICLCLKKKEIQNIVVEKKEESVKETTDNKENKENIVVSQCKCELKEKEINGKLEKLEKDLRAENYELKNEIYYLKDDINRYKKIIDSNKKEIKTLKTQIKDLKTLLDENVKHLTEKINSINTSNTINTSNSNTINNIKDESINKSKNNSINEKYENLNINKEIKENNNINKSYNEQHSKDSFSPKKSLNTTKNNNKKSQKKMSVPVANPVSSASKSTKNQEKKINNKREIYQQMKAANAQKLNNNNKEKTSFAEFLKQKKNAGSTSNNLLNSVEVKEPTKENKKVLQKNNTTDFVPVTTKIKVNQSAFINKNSKQEIKFYDNKKENEQEQEQESKQEKEQEHEHEQEQEQEQEQEHEHVQEEEQEKDSEKENENDNNNKDEEEEENLDNVNINENKYVNTEYNNIEKKWSENENDYGIERIKTYDMNRGDKIDQWKFDFDINVKKLLQDNESKLKLAEKLNNMNRRIINNIDELQLIENQLYKNYPDTKDIEYTLLYRGSEHGDSSESFHEKCDNSVFTLTIIKNMDGHKFGGYTEESWEGENVSKKDYNSFCFSLSKNKIYNIKPDKNAIICDPNLGPSFGGPLFKIFDNYFNKGGKCYPKDKCGFIGQDNDFEITNGKEDFEINEIEVYRLTFK